MSALISLLNDVRTCTLCAEYLPLGPRPVLQVHESARILIAGQAPSKRVHETGIPFNDPSGDRLRKWMGISYKSFYDPTQVAILPMGFCYPGTGKFGDLPPRRECSVAWRATLLSHLKNLKLTLILGQHAQAYHLPKDGKGSGVPLTEAVRAWREKWPRIVSLPHPSPRNNIWLKRNPWFETELIPVLRARVSEILRLDG